MINGKFAGKKFFLWHAVFVLRKQVFVHRTNLANEKIRHLAAMLASAERLGVALPDCAWLHVESANGPSHGKSRTECLRADLPQTVIAGRRADHSAETGRGDAAAAARIVYGDRDDAAAATWIVRGDEMRRRRGL